MDWGIRWVVKGQTRAFFWGVGGRGVPKCSRTSYRWLDVPLQRVWNLIGFKYGKLKVWFFKHQFREHICILRHVDNPTSLTSDSHISCILIKIGSNMCSFWSPRCLLSNETSLTQKFVMVENMSKWVIKGRFLATIVF